MNSLGGVDIFQPIERRDAEVMDAERELVLDDRFGAGLVVVASP